MRRALLSLGLLAAGICSPAVAQQRQVLRYAETPLSPGGGIEQFAKGAEIFRLSGQSSDNEATFFALWDFGSLTFGVQVRDSLLYCTPMQPDSRYTYNNDSVELNFDLQNKKTLEYGDKGFRQWIFPLDYQKNPYDAYGCGNTGDSTFDGQAQVDVGLQGTLNDDQQDEGYWMVIQIPWSDLDLTPKNGLVFGFDGAVNDIDDLFGSFSTMDWAELEVFAQPALWNELELTGGPAAPPADGSTRLDAGPAGDGAARSDAEDCPSCGPVTEGAGCSCRQAGDRQGSGWWLVLLLLLLALHCLRRRTSALH